MGKTDLDTCIFKQAHRDHKIIDEANVVVSI